MYENRDGEYPEYHPEHGPKKSAPETGTIRADALESTEEGDLYEEPGSRVNLHPPQGEVPDLDDLLNGLDEKLGKDGNL